jgi:hypothetical protein
MNYTEYATRTTFSIICPVVLKLGQGQHIDLLK